MGIIQTKIISYMYKSANLQLKIHSSCMTSDNTDIVQTNSNSSTEAGPKHQHSNWMALDAFNPLCSSFRHDTNPCVFWINFVMPQWLKWMQQGLHTSRGLSDWLIWSISFSSHFFQNTKHKCFWSDGPQEVKQLQKCGPCASIYNPWPFPLFFSFLEKSRWLGKFELRNMFFFTNYEAMSHNKKNRFLQEESPFFTNQAIMETKTKNQNFN